MRKRRPPHRAGEAFSPFNRPACTGQEFWRALDPDGKPVGRWRREFKTAVMDCANEALAREFGRGPVRVTVDCNVAVMRGKALAEAGWRVQRGTAS